MNYRPLGNTGIQVSEIGLGCWQFANNVDWNLWSTHSPEKIIDKALELGCNFFDTAPGYSHGHSEEVLGNLLPPVREKVIISTKFGYSVNEIFDFNPKLIRQSLEDSLRRLKTDYIDVFLFHVLPNESIIEHCAILEKLKLEGKIRVYGASVSSSTELLSLLETSSQVAEIHFNAFYQEPAVSFSKAQEKGLGLIVKVPLDSGWLAGAYSPNSKFTGSRSRWTQETINRRFELIKKFSEIIPENLSMSQSSLQFILSYSEVSTVIPGAETPEQAADNFSASGVRLSMETIQAINALWETEIKTNPLGW
jgi:aryl-alcohol dehydrogenase-like predicted oxidoreductase